MGQGASEVEPLVITRKRMMFVNTTAIAYGQNIGRSLMILAVCNSSCVDKRHAFASTRRMTWIAAAANTSLIRQVPSRTA